MNYNIHHNRDKIKHLTLDLIYFLHFILEHLTFKNYSRPEEHENSAYYVILCNICKIFLCDGRNALLSHNNKNAYSLRRQVRLEDYVARITLARMAGDHFKEVGIYFRMIIKHRNFKVSPMLVSPPCRGREA
jgi:hypothetical protein